MNILQFSHLLGDNLDLRCLALRDQAMRNRAQSWRWINWFCLAVILNLPFSLSSEQQWTNVRLADRLRADHEQKPEHKI